MDHALVSDTQDFTRKIFGYLNGRVPYAVLRNYEHLPQSNAGRDIDIIVRKSDFNKVEKPLARLVASSGWQIVACLRSDRLATLVCGKLGCGGAELIQWDFFFNTSIYGIELMSAGELLLQREFNGEVYHVSKAGEFLDKFLYVRAAGLEYPRKYAVTRDAVADDPAVAGKLQRLFGCGSIAEAERAPGRKLLRRALFSNLRKHPLRQAGRILRFLSSHIANYFRSNAGFSIAFTGPDGAGKTTVIRLLHRQVSPVLGEAAVFFHFNPALLPNLGEAAHAAGFKKEVDRAYDKPHRGGRKGPLNSFVRLCYYTADYLLGYWVKVKPHMRIVRMVVFDRYYTDVITDSRRSCIYLGPGFLYRWGRLFIPSLDYNILLTASTDVILGRKQELDRAGIGAIDAKLDYLAGRKGYYLVRNDGEANDAVQAILEIVFAGQDKKNRKKLGLKE
ncbi:hypothetical protein [uncultured Alistipes sp.]|jgi:hypothetical protein|uniref:hypothetical protein n=1 Tax=uncultured Alistipes sp. TaxID=538949 RepID=UPI0025EFB9BF|nr:hypothetical protein [uncultured Alistipes sp.]